MIDHGLVNCNREARAHLSALNVAQASHDGKIRLPDAPKATRVDYVPIPDDPYALTNSPLRLD